MPDVFIRGLPDDVYAWLKQQARLAKRTVPAKFGISWHGWRMPAIKKARTPRID